MRPLWPPPTTTASQSARGELGDRARAGRPLRAGRRWRSCDGLLGWTGAVRRRRVDGDGAVRATITGLSSSSARPCVEQQLAGGGGERAAAATSSGGRPRPPVSTARRAAAQRGSTRAGVDGQRQDGDVVERLGPERRRGRRRARARPRRRGRRRAARRPAAPCARRAPVAARRRSRSRAASRTAAGVGEVRARTPPTLGLVPQARAGGLDRHGRRRARARRRPRRRRVRRRGPRGTGDAGAAQQRLRLVLGRASASPCRRRAARRAAPIAAIRAGSGGGAPSAAAQRSPVRSPADAGSPSACSAAAVVVGSSSGSVGGDARPAPASSRAPRADGVEHGVPRVGGRAVEPGGLVVAARARGRSRGSPPSARDERAQRVVARPTAATCSRAGWRGRRRRAGRPPARRPSPAASAGSVDAELRGEVGGHAPSRRPSRSCTADAAAAPRRRPLRPARQRLGQLEQLVRVARPGRAARPRRTRGTRAGRRRARRCAPARPPRPRRRRAGLEHRDADARPRARARAPRTSARRRRRPRGRARSSARRRARRAPRRSPRRRAPRALPHETTVCSRSPRRDASALTATLPLCGHERDRARPARRDHVAPQRRARGERRRSRCRSGPHTGRSCAARGRGQRGLSRRRRARLGEARRRTPRRRRSPSAPACSTTVGAPPPGRRPRPRRAPPAGRASDGHARGRRARCARPGLTAYTAPVEAEPAQVEQRLAAVGSRAARWRRRRRPSAGRSRRVRSISAAPRSTPRRSSERATISRWISLVPSQMRSTRSSRQKRSATFVRM